MNNKGFAITGILYTLLILFLLLVGSFLGVLRFKNHFLQKSIDSLEDDLVFVEVSDVDGILVAACDGKFVFLDENGDSCTSYLGRGNAIDPEGITYTTDACNASLSKSSFQLERVYYFEGSGNCES